MSKSLQEAVSTKAPRLPRDVRKFKILQAEFKVSEEKKTPMYVFTMETEGNQPEIVEGQQIDPNGQKGMKWLVITEGNAKRLGIVLKRIGINDLGSISVATLLANPNPQMFVGKHIYLICETVSEVQKKEDGVTPLKTPEGEVVVQEQFQVGDIV